jgi:hypothetical protein
MKEDDDSRIIRTLRSQAWQRAKGELHAMLQTFYPGTKREGQFDELSDLVDEFIGKVENSELQD